MKVQRFDLANLPDEALIGIDAVIAIGPFGRTKFYDEVAAGRAPQPALKLPRCTRWRLGDIRAWLHALAAGGA